MGPFTLKYETETRRQSGSDGVASRIGGSGLLVFCQIGQGYGGRGSVTLNRRGKGNIEDVCLVNVQSTVHYLGNV